MNICCIGIIGGGYSFIYIKAFVTEIMCNNKNAIAVLDEYGHNYTIGLLKEVDCGYSYVGHMPYLVMLRTDDVGFLLFNLAGGLEYRDTSTLMLNNIQ